MPVGRLDAESTGLLLWTDDGDLAQLLCRPASQIWKVYQVVLETFLDASARTDLVSGKLELDGRACLPLRIEMAEPADGRHLNLQMHEGRYRQIRRMFGQLGLKVVSLHRVQIGPIVMGRLKAGCFRRLTAVEESRLRRTAQNENQDSS